MTRRLILRDWEASAWHAGRLSAVVRPFRSRYDWYIGEDDDGQPWPYFRDYVSAEPDPEPVPCPLGPPGQRLWIAESWSGRKGVSIHSYMSHLFYRADGYFQTGKQVGFTYMERERNWRSPATMPSWASRSEAVHQGSRLVQVQSVTEAEAKACGVGEWQPCTMRWVSHDPIKDFASQFIADHGQAAWDRNDLVWVHRIGRV